MRTWYWSGFFAGLSAAAIATLAYLVLAYLPDLAAALRDFGSTSPPPIPTRLVLSPVWRLLAPLGLATALVVSHLPPSPRGDRARLLLLAITAAAAIGALLFTRWAAQLPFTQLARDISS